MPTAVLEPPRARPRAAGEAADKARPRKSRVKTIRNAQGVHAEHVIVHVIDHLNAEEPVLSDSELSLEPDARLQSYFEKQIENVLTDPETADAKFLDGDSGVAAACFEILESPRSFIAASQRIAKALWDATGGDKRISAGSLIVCQFQADNHGVPLLALLKVDPTDVLLQSVSRAQGRVVVSLRIAENALPTARERLQKAALVAPQGYAQRCDLLLLDRLVAKPAADFFAGRFLNVRPIPSAHERTDAFYRGYLDAQNELSEPEGPSLTPEQKDYLDGRVVDALHRRRLDVAAWVEELELPEDAKEVVSRQITDQLDTRQFEIDPVYREKLVPKRRIRGDCGILIEFQRQFQDQVFREGQAFVREDGVFVTPVTLEVPNLKWVK